MKIPLPIRFAISSIWLGPGLALFTLFFTVFQAAAQTPYSNFDNQLLIPDTLSTWPPNTHSIIPLEIKESSRQLFPNASPTNPAIPGYPFHTADTKPIATKAYYNDATSNPAYWAPR